MCHRRKLQARIGDRRKLQRLTVHNIGQLRMRDQHKEHPHKEHRRKLHGRTEYLSKHFSMRRQTRCRRLKALVASLSRLAQRPSQLPMQPS